MTSMTIQISGFLPWHAFTTRQGGVSAPPTDSLDLSLVPSAHDDTDESSEKIAENARRLARSLGIVPEEIAAVRQVHGTHIIRVRRSGLSGGLFSPLAEADGMVTDEPGIALAIRTADCVPILIASKPDAAHSPVIAALHAGWRGTIGLIAERAVRLIERDFGIPPDSLTAAIGPAIGQCCYEVSSELSERFCEAFGPQIISSAPTSEGHQPHLDLKTANQIALMRAGLSPEDIYVCPLCTSCRSDLFFSHRRDAGQTGRQLSLIMIPRRAQTDSRPKPSTPESSIKEMP